MFRTATVASKNVDGEAVGEVSKEELGLAVGSVPATVVNVICFVGLGDIVGDTSNPTPAELAIASLPAFITITGGAVKAEAVEGAAHEMPAKQVIPSGHPAPVGQLVASEQLDKASSYSLPQKNVL